MATQRIFDSFSGAGGGDLYSTLPPSINENISTKRDLTSWWKQFVKGTPKRFDEKETSYPAVFGVPLQTSIRYANVAISLYDSGSPNHIYGYVPIVVAKCGVFLKEKATDVEGIFRLSGSEKRIKELRNAFNSPDRYGKGLDWSGYTVHDAANILRRYFNQLPEPIIPLELYDKFREPLRKYLSDMSEGDVSCLSMGMREQEDSIRIYQQLILELPPLHRQLLLYILDLLAVFASKSDLNKMTTANLAAIFQPGILSHPAHDMSPQEYRLSQEVLVFLIEKQDHFLIGMQDSVGGERSLPELRNVNITGNPTRMKMSSVRSRLGFSRSVSTSNVNMDTYNSPYNVRRSRSYSSRKSSKATLVSTSSPRSPPYSYRPHTFPMKGIPSPRMLTNSMSSEQSSPVPLRSSESSVSYTS